MPEPTQQSTPVPPLAPSIHTPASYVTLNAVAYAGADGRAVPVDSQRALPVALSYRPGSAAPLEGATSQSGTVGPFTAEAGRPIALSLSGEWSGRVQLVQSRDGGATLEPLTVAGQEWAIFTAPANEPVWEPVEAGLTFHLVIDLASGTLAYRVSQ